MDPKENSSPESWPKKQNSHCQNEHLNDCPGNRFKCTNRIIFRSQSRSKIDCLFEWCGRSIPYFIIQKNFKAIYCQHISQINSFSISRNWTESVLNTAQNQQSCILHIDFTLNIESWSVAKWMFSSCCDSTALFDAPKWKNSWVQSFHFNSTTSFYYSL